VINKTLNRLRFTWESFSEREKWIISTLGVILLLFLFTLPLFLMTRANSALQESNQELRTLLETLASKSDRLIQEANERRLAERRYEQQTPPLGGFLETLARDQGLTISEVTDQPQKAQGRFLRRNVQISIPNVALSPLMNLLSAIKSSRYPVAIDQIQIDHFRAGDAYNAKLGVVTYDKEGSRPSKAVSSTEGEDKGNSEKETVE
jgi:type II secretory pathway component PulM